MSNLDDFDAFFDDEEIPKNPQHSWLDNKNEINRIEINAQV